MPARLESKWVFLCVSILECLFDIGFFLILRKHVGWFVCSMYLGAIKFMETELSNISYALRTLSTNFSNDTHDQLMLVLSTWLLKNRILMIPYRYFTGCRCFDTFINRHCEIFIRCQTPSPHNVVHKLLFAHHNRGRVGLACIQVFAKVTP